MKKIVVIIVLLLIIVAGYFVFRDGGILRAPSNDTENGEDITLTWNAHTNNQYGFEIRYPEGWRVYTGTLPGNTPIINIYKIGETENPPFSHHSQVTNVSIFPHGVPTEGVVGQTVRTTVDMNMEVERGFDYILGDGERWATYMTFAIPPESWEPWGFAWARTLIVDGGELCLRNGEEVPLQNCDLGIESEGTTLVRTGSINTEDRRIQEQILSTLRFLDDVE
jgi:hypothetical protein